MSRDKYIAEELFTYLEANPEIARLLLAKINEEEWQRKIETKAEVEGTIERHIREKQELLEKLPEQDRAIWEKEKIIAEQDRFI